MPKKSKVTTIITRSTLVFQFGGYAVSFWLPLWIAFTQAMQRIPRVLVQWYCLMMTEMMTGKNVTEIMWLGQYGRLYVGWLLKWIGTLLTVVIGKDKTNWGKVIRSTHIRSRWQNILTELSGVIGQAQKATTLFETWNCRLQMKF